MANQTILEAEGLSVSYGPVRAFSDVSLRLHEGGLLLLLGPNGAGKTSLVNSIAGLVSPRAGQIRLNGTDVTRTRAFHRVRLGISLVPEGRGALPGLSVEDNLYLGWRAAPRDRRGSLGTGLKEVFDLFPRLDERRRQDCSTLSGGEMQMLAIARSFISRPQVLLLDEPSLGLAPQAVAAVYAALGELHKDGLAMVIVEQKAVPLSVVPETTLVLQGGHIVYSVAGSRPTEDQLARLYLGELGKEVRS